ncbi:MAG TPA: hypothetical protein ENG13_04330 [bacterium]|nr:hypothetical protein [bacterium]HEX68273.1 hypothetical protein [bacterium]
MIKNPVLWEKFEKEWIKKEKLSFLQRFKIFQLLLDEAKVLGVFPSSDPLEEIEKDIKMAKILNSLKK